MTDKEIIALWKMCDSRETCEGCPEWMSDGFCDVDRYCDPHTLIPMLEALISENEHLREVTKMVPQWHPASEPPEKYGRYLCIVKSKVMSGRTLVCTCGYDEDGFFCGFDRSYDVTHWMPLPSTEGVE